MARCEFAVVGLMCLIASVLILCGGRTHYTKVETDKYVNF